MSGYADNWWQRRAIQQNMDQHTSPNGDATPEEWASRFNAARDLFEQAQEEEMAQWKNGSQPT